MRDGTKCVPKYIGSQRALNQRYATRRNPIIPPRRSLLRLARQVYICANTYICIYLPTRWARTRSSHALCKDDIRAAIVALIRARSANDGTGFVCLVWAPAESTCPLRRFRRAIHGVNIRDEIRVENYAREWEMTRGRSFTGFPHGCL